MGTLYLVRHGQASFGAANYDQLSPLGQQQCLRLGDYFAQRGQQFEAVITGTLQRQQQSAAAIAQAMGGQPEPLRNPALNEYDSAAVIHTVHPEPLPKPDTPELYRHHFRVLRQGLAAWMAGQVQPAGMPSYADFLAGVMAVLDHVRQNHRGDVLVVSSGGPISTAVARLLNAPPEVSIDLNMRLRNSAITELVSSRDGHQLLSFNHLPHLDSDAHRSWVTAT